MRDTGAGDTQRGRQQRRARKDHEKHGASSIGAAVAQAAPPKPKVKVVRRRKGAAGVSVPVTPPRPRADVTTDADQRRAQEQIQKDEQRARRRALALAALASNSRGHSGGPGDLLQKEAEAQRASEEKAAKLGPGIFTPHNALEAAKFVERRTPIGLAADTVLHGPKEALHHQTHDFETATGINPEHPLDAGPWWLAGNAATLFPPFRAVRAGVELGRGIKAGEDFATAADRAVQSFHAPGPVAKAAKTVRGKRAIARVEKAMKESPVRADAHAHFDATSPTPEAAQMQKDLYDRHVRGLAVALRHDKQGTQQLLDHLAGAGQRPAAAADLHPVLGDLHALYQAHPLPNVEMPAKVAGGPMHQKVFELARQGAQYRDWYQRAAWMVQLTAEHLGVPFDKMAQIVAITSQGANPTLNLRDAVVAVKSFQRFGHVKIGAANPGLWKPHEVEAVLNGGEWSGRKRSSFYQNIAHLGTDHVTVDRHVANMLFGTKSPSEKQYQQAEAIFRDIADQLGWQPSEVQAAMWVPWKALQKAGRTGADVGRYMPDAADAYEKGFSNIATGMDWQRPVGSRAKPRALRTDEKNFFTLAAERDAGTDLEGLPTKAKYRGAEIPVHSNAEAQRLADQYMSERGMPYDPPHTYAKVDKERAKRIAEWYDAAVDAPDDPAVRAAYDAMARETLAQYNTITEAGYTFEFYPEGVDPYPGGPRDAMTDLLANKHMYVFPTDAGFGTEHAAAGTHPLLADSGVRWGDKAITHNDVFRAVHDFFGHFKEGVGFRADGEENAWRAHSAMYSPEARPAMTSETRGQNSWVNFGPHGEANRTAMQGETVYADQKAVLAPDWVVTEGAGDTNLHGLTPEEQQQYQEWLAAHPDTKVPRAKVSGLASGIPIGGDEDAALININLDKPKLTPREELKQHPIRQAAHENIDETVGDPELRAAMKKAYDEQALQSAERAKMTPSQFLEKRAATQPDAAAKVRAGMTGGKASTQREAQDIGYSVERGNRFSAFKEELQANPTLEGFSVASEHLRGELPKLQFNGIRGLTEDEMDSLVAHVAVHPELTDGEVKRVLDATRAAWLEGKVPTRSEIKLMRTAYGTKFSDAAFAPEVLNKYKHALYETLNIPRSLMASFDVSAPLRQGLVALASHPLITAKNFGPMFRYLTSEKGYHAFMEELRLSPDYEQMLKDGLDITDLEHTLSNREEQFASSYAEKLTGLGVVAGKPGKLSFVRGSGRAYTGFLVKTRVDLYRAMLQKAEAAEHTLTPEAREQLASLVNAATGRGDLGSWERSAVKLNALFFSPRLMASRFEFLNPFKYRGLDPFVRKEKLKMAMKTASLVGGVLYLGSLIPGVHVAINPTSSDFGKMRIGNVRIDVAGGFTQYMRVAASLAEQGAHTVGIGPGDADASKKIWRFLRGKESPLLSLGHDAFTGTNYADMPIKDRRKELYDHFIPLVIQDARDVYNQTGSVAAAAGAVAGSGTGLGVQAYGAKQTAPAKTYAQKQDDLKAKIQQTWGDRVPSWVDQAIDLKASYHDARDQFKKDHGVTKLTRRQEITVKAGILETVDPDKAQKVTEYLQTHPQISYKDITGINSWVEQQLHWDKITQIQRALAQKEHASGKY